MKIFIVIPNYSVNQKVITLAINAIRSFKKTAECTVVVVDDKSPLDTSLIRQEADVFLQKEVNEGFAATCNKGFRFALAHDADYIICANSDIEAPEGWLEEFMYCYKKFKADLVCGLCYKEKNTKKPLFNYYSEGGRFEDWLFSGAFWIMDHEFLMTTGFLDENYLHGGMEDIDLFFRANLNGKKLIMTPHVWFWHKEGATRHSKEEIGKQTIEFRKNEEYFNKKFCINYKEHLTSTILKFNKIIPRQKT